MQTNAMRDREDLRREYKKQLDLRAFYRWLQLESARNLLPDEHGVPRETLRSRYLPASEAEVPVSAIVGFIEKLRVFEGHADERVRALAMKLGLNVS